MRTVPSSFDVDGGAGFFADGADGCATLADDVADLVESILIAIVGSGR
jgi:hypothetical protein